VASLLAGTTSVVLASAGPDALVPFKDAAGAATLVSVEFVLDFGTSQPVVGCAKVPSGDNGYQALAAFTQQENLAPPTYAPSGLLCSINGTPDPNGPCGQSSSGGYIYWSYWHGSSGSWQYSNAGASGTVSDGDVEGWRFQNPGHGNPSDPPPAVAPAYAGVCGPVVPVTTTTTGTPTQPSTPGTTLTPASVGASPSTKATQPAQPVPAPISTTTPTTPTSTTTTPATSGSTSSSSTTPPPTGQSNHDAQSLRATPANLQRGSGESPIPFIIGGLIVLALVTASVLRWRKRPEGQ
jgi:hypothetical protein